MYLRRPFTPFVSSETAISWSATLHPFADELPRHCDWVEFVSSDDPTGEADRLKRKWTWDDDRNHALEQAIPVRFVRSTIIDHANGDLALAALGGASASVDALHHQVVAQRFNDDTTWRLRGYAVPFLFPRVGSLPWDAVAELRRHATLSDSAPS